MIKKIKQPPNTESPPTNWIVDVVASSNKNNSVLQSFVVIDEHTKVILSSTVINNFQSHWLTTCLDQCVMQYGAPSMIKCDNSKYFHANRFQAWASDKAILIGYGHV